MIAKHNNTTWRDQLLLIETIYRRWNEFWREHTTKQGGNSKYEH